MTRDQIRQKNKAQRLTLSADDVESCSSQIADNVLSSEIFKQSQHIACYFAVHNEVSCSTIIDAIFAQSKQCYLPIMHEETNEIHFVECKKDSTLIKNHFGILEPQGEKVEIDKLDLVLMPLLAFDKQGNRLGMGLGCYDKVLANKKEKPLLCGLAYAFQEVDEIKKEVWDVPIDLAVTESDRGFPATKRQTN